MIAMNEFLLSFLLNGLIIFIFSFILNFILFYLVTVKLFGIYLKERFTTNFNENSHFFFIIPFIVSFFIINNLSSNSILLEDTVRAIVETGNGEIEFSGEFIKLLFTHLGSAAVFSTSARIAAGLVAKYHGQLGLLPQSGIICAAGAGFTATYNAVVTSVPTATTGAVLNTRFKIQLVLKDQNSTTANTLNSSHGKGLINQWLGVDGSSKINKEFSCTVNNAQGSQETIITVKNAENSRVVEELNRTVPDWYNQFINSPLEKGDLLNSPFLQSISDLIHTNLFLHFIILYLLIMLVIIYSCKVLLENNIHFNNILNYPLGKYIHKILNFYINIWKKNASFWIYFILFSLIIFNCGIVISLYKILSAIQ